MATARAERRRALSRVLALVLVMALPWLAGCASAPPAAPSTGPARIALPFSRAVPALTVSLLANAQLGAPDAGGRYPMMVDPWIDQGSGMPVEATRPIEAQIAAQLRRSIRRSSFCPSARPASRGSPWCCSAPWRPFRRRRAAGPVAIASGR